MIELVKVIETCMACPSQWDAWDAEGNYYYLRFRFGRGSVSRDHDDRKAIITFRHGDDLSGCLELGEFIELADGVELAENAIVVALTYDD